MALPTGPAVSFLFTDIEGSTRLERAAGSAAWAALVARHDDLLRASIERRGGVVVKTEGDAFFAAFDSPTSAVAAAVDAQRAIAAEAWPDDLAIRVRMGIHLGEGRLRGARPNVDDDYVGIDVNYTARITATANGGQIVVSGAVVAAMAGELARTAGLGDVELVDDGLRSVKDFEDPAPLYRLVVPGVADDPRPLRTLDVPSNLPGEVTSFVGRVDEIEAVRADLVESRIVTLTGPGGSGKTRLALAVARDIRDRYPHGVWFVDLAALRDPALMEPAIAATLGVRESPERAIGDALRAHLRDRTALLVLDNLEQLLPAGADVVAGLARGAPNVCLLVTSRELLRIGGERGHPIPPLDVTAGIALFVDRAHSHRPDLVLNEDTLAAIRTISERLDGLPLALELAAARVRVMSPVSILERLGRSLDLAGGTRDQPERQRTLRGAVAWSHDLLTPEERRLFARLAVFASGWTADAAWSVADPDGDLGLDVLTGLESLADKSLVRIEIGAGATNGPDGSAIEEVETRFSLHPILREFALERLTESGERPQLETRFVHVCVEIAESAGGAIFGPAGEANMRRLDREDRNMRAAADWALANDEAGLGLRIVGGIWRWFQQRGRIREARALLTELLARPSPADVHVRIAGLAAEGGLAYWMKDFPAARTAYEERLELAAATGDPILLADAHYDLGFLSMVAQDREALREHEQLALDLYLAAGDEEAATRARQAIVLSYFLGGDYQAAADLEYQNLDVFRRIGSRFQVADSTTLLSAIHWRLGDPITAWTRVSEALTFFSAIEGTSGLARALAMVAIILLSDGDAEFGGRVAGAAYRMVREQGAMLAPVEVLHLPDPAGLATERFGADRTAELLAEGAAVPLAEIAAQILALPSPTG